MSEQKVNERKDIVKRYKMCRILLDASYVYVFNNFKWSSEAVYPLQGKGESSAILFMQKCAGLSPVNLVPKHVKYFVWDSCFSRATSRECGSVWYYFHLQPTATCKCLSSVLLSRQRDGSQVYPLSLCIRLYCYMVKTDQLHWASEGGRWHSWLTLQDNIRMRQIYESRVKRMLWFWLSTTFFWMLKYLWVT